MCTNDPIEMQTFGPLQNPAEILKGMYESAGVLESMGTLRIPMLVHEPTPFVSQVKFYHPHELINYYAHLKIVLLFLNGLTIFYNVGSEPKAASFSKSDVSSVTELRNHLESQLRYCIDNLPFKQRGKWLKFVTNVRD